MFTAFFFAIPRDSALKYGNSLLKKARTLTVRTRNNTSLYILYYMNT